MQGRAHRPAVVAGHPQLTTRASFARLRVGLVLTLALLGGCAETPPPPAAIDASARLFARAYTEVMEYYVEPRTAKQVALPALERIATLDPALSVTASGGEIVVQEGAVVVLRVAQPADRDPRGWGVATSAALHGAKAASPTLAALADDRIEQVVFAGLTASLDRFSRYADPGQARDEHAARDGVDGIGVTIDSSHRQMRVGTVVPGGPAARGGVMPGDLLVEIDGAPTATLSRRDVLQRLRGPAGTRVALSLKRDGTAELLHRTISREFLVVPTVIGGRDGNIAILRVSSFNQHTTDSLQDELARLRQQMGEAQRGIILDLRGNPGGLLDQAISVADLFLDGGPIVATRGRNSASSEAFDASLGDVAAGLPMVVLINGGSASAAEIVAAALQDSGRAVVIGSPSFGKGTVQTQLRLPNDGELTLTSARLYAPSGYLLHEHGVVPDLCTAGLPDRFDGVEPLLEHRISIMFGRAPRRQTLDEAGWTGLRRACGTDSGEHPAETRAALRVLGDPVLYAALAHDEKSTLAARPVPAKDTR
jgi:carboxyl-terminal processing protease